MSAPLVAKNAVLWDGTAAIAWIKEVRWRIRSEPVKDYKSDSLDPAILEAGNMTYEISFRRFYINKIYAEKVKTGTKITAAEIRPAGTGAGLEKITFGNLLFLEFEGQWANTAIYESVSCEAASVVFGTQ